MKVKGVTLRYPFFNLCWHKNFFTIFDLPKTSGMPQIKPEDVFKVTVLSIKDFAATHAVAKEAIYYAIKHGLVDYIPLGREKFIVMTDHSRQYLPNLHPSREQKAKPKTRKKATLK